MEWKGGGGPTGFSAFKRCSYSWQMPLSASPIVSKSLKVLDAWEAARFAAVSDIKLMGGWVLLIPHAPLPLRHCTPPSSRDRAMAFYEWRCQGKAAGCVV